MFSEEIEAYERWEQVYPPGFDDIECRGYGLTEAYVAEVNSFLLKISTDEHLKMQLIKPKKGASDIFYEVIPGVGYRGDYVVHTPGDYFIKIVIGNRVMPTLKIQAHESDEDYETTIEQSINYLLERKQKFTESHYAFLKQNYGLPDVDIEKMGQLFGHQFKEKYAIIEETMRNALTEIRKSMYHLTQFPDCFLSKFRHINQANVPLPQENLGSDRSTSGSVFYDNRTNVAHENTESSDPHSETSIEPPSDTSTPSSDSRKRKRNGKNETSSKRIRDSSSSDEYDTAESSIEMMRFELDDDQEEAILLTDSDNSRGHEGDGEGSDEDDGEGGDQGAGQGGDQGAGQGGDQGAGQGGDQGAGQGGDQGAGQGGGQGAGQGGGQGAGQGGDQGAGQGGDQGAGQGGDQGAGQGGDQGAGQGGDQGAGQGGDQGAGQGGDQGAGQGGDQGAGESSDADAGDSSDAEAGDSSDQDSSEDDDEYDKEEYERFLEDMRSSRESRRLLDSTTEDVLKDIFKERKKGHNRKTRNKTYDLRKKS